MSVGQTLAPQYSMPAQGRGLNSLWLEITQGCNQACVHCYTESTPFTYEKDVVPTSRWKSVIDEAAELETKHVQLIGGEPTTHKDFTELLQYAHGKDFKIVEVYTNGSALKDEMIDEFARLGTHVAFSFYSDKAEVHERVTRNKGSFDRTARNVKRMVDAGIPLRAGVIATPENSSKENIRAAMKYLDDLGVHDYGTDRVRGVGRGLMIIQESEYDALCGACWSGKLVVTSIGDAFPCVMSRFEPIGNVLTDSLQDIVESEVLKQFREKVYKMSKERNGDDVSCKPNRTCTHRGTPAEDDTVESKKCAPKNPGCRPSRKCNPRREINVDYKCSPDDDSDDEPDDYCGPDTDEPTCGPDPCSPD